MYTIDIHSFGKTLTITVKPNDKGEVTGLNIKTEIQNAEKLPIINQRLVYRIRELGDDTNLLDLIQKSIDSSEEFQKGCEEREACLKESTTIMELKEELAGKRDISMTLVYKSSPAERARFTQHTATIMQWLTT